MQSMILGKKSCDNCSGLDSCIKYCEVRMGENIVKFVNGIDCVESSIGDIRKDIDTTNRKAIYMVTGMELAKGCSPISCITTIPQNGMQVYGKLQSYNGFNPMQLLKKYTEYCKLPKPVQDKATEDLKKFNSNRIIPTPFKVGADIEILHIGFDNKKHKTLTNADHIKWNIDENGILRGTIVANVGRTDTGSSFAKVKLSEYGTSWFLPNLERNMKTSEIKYDAIRMNDLGLIDAVEVVEGKESLALDGRFLYWSKNGVTNVVGAWNGNVLELNKEAKSRIEKMKAFKYISDRVKFIEKHKRFIIPYKLSEANSVII